MTKRRIFGIVVILVLALFQHPAVAYDSYNNYVYSNDFRQQLEPQAYIPYKIITGESLGTESFLAPKDVFVTKEGNVYICDTGNNRILVLNKELNLMKVIDSFINEGTEDTFNEPTGLIISEDDLIYIADSLNGRIVVLDKDGLLKKIHYKPQSELLTGTFQYEPIKVAVDSGNRIYIISKGETQGIIQLSQEGEFFGFFGAINTTPSILNSIIRRFGTEKMKENTALSIPTIYSNIFIDRDDFVYSVVGSLDPATASGNMYVHKLNSMGVDILKRYGRMPIYGDGPYWDFDTARIETSYFADIVSNDQGLYSVLDRRSGKIFTYDDNTGNLLYVFGAIGVKMGQMGLPEALDFIFNDHYIVVDSKYNQLVLFKPTFYGETVVKAVKAYHESEFETMQQYWETAKSLSAKSEMVYAGVGKAYYRTGDYANAMKYFKIGNDRSGYSQSFEHFRREFMNRYFAVIMNAFIIIILISFIIRKKVYKKICKKIKNKNFNNKENRG